MRPRTLRRCNHPRRWRFGCGSRYQHEPWRRPHTLLHQRHIGGVLDSQGGDEGGCIVPAREKSSWRKLGGNVAVCDGVCAAHSGVAATGIRGNGRGGHPRGCGDGGSAVWGSAAAAAGGRSGGLVAMVEADFWRFNTVEASVWAGIELIKKNTSKVSKVGNLQFHASLSGVFLDNSSVTNTPQTPYSFESYASQLSD